MCLRLKDGSGDKAAVISENADLVSLLTKVERIELLGAGEGKPSQCLSTVTGEWELFFPVGELLDVEKEIKRLGSELEKLEKETERTRAKLSNANFIDRAPAEVVEKERLALEAAVSQKKRIEENIASLA
jgi:valyl-tRNA synthetase